MPLSTCAITNDEIIKNSRQDFDTRIKCHTIVLHILPAFVPSPYDYNSALNTLGLQQTHETCLLKMVVCRQSFRYAQVLHDYEA